MKHHQDLNKAYAEGEFSTVEFNYFMMLANIAKLFVKAANISQLGFQGFLFQAAFYRGAMKVTFLLRDELMTRMRR
jgi:hypothetical protein